MPRLPEPAAYVATFGSMTAAAIVVIALIVIDGGGGDGPGKTSPADSPAPTGAVLPNGVPFLYGKVAVSINDPTIETSQLWPGDWVDVHAKFDGEVEPIVEGVQVLSVAMEEQPSLTGGSRPGSTTVTLAMTPEHAQALTSAQGRAASLSLSRSASSIP